MKTIVVFAICLATLLVLDGIWLVFIAKNFYKANLGHLITDKPNWLAAGVFYLIFVTGVMVFVVTPGMADQNAVRSAFMGALFGFVAYATYDLTNQATMREWPYLVTVVDLAWGAALTGVVSYVTVTLSKLLYPA